MQVSIAVVLLRYLDAMELLFFSNWCFVVAVSYIRYDATQDLYRYMETGVTLWRLILEILPRVLWSGALLLLYLEREG